MALAALVFPTDDIAYPSNVFKLAVRVKSKWDGPITFYRRSCT